MTLKRYAPAFPKPKDMILRPTHISVRRDGREVCVTTNGNLGYIEGRKEYRLRVAAMWERQKGICCLYGHCPTCPGALLLSEATFEHENGRGAGKRDDRIEADGIWINGAAHHLCNMWKGSRRIDYNTALQGKRPEAHSE